MGWPVTLSASPQGACPPACTTSGAPALQGPLFSDIRLPLAAFIYLVFGFLQPQLVLGGTAQTASLGTATAVQTGAPQRTVQGATTTSTAATVSAASGAPPPGQHGQSAPQGDRGLGSGT